MSQIDNTHSCASFDVIRFRIKSVLHFVSDEKLNAALLSLSIWKLAEFIFIPFLKTMKKKKN